MEPDILSEVQRLRAERVPFALATVVVAQHPTSGTLGARAIVTPDGKIRGWVGGSCAQPTVVREGLRALADGSPRLVVLSPDRQADATPKPGVVEAVMTCASQGELQVFVEPFLPKIELVVVGSSPVARTVARLGALLDFEVYACDPAADRESFPEADRWVDSLEALAPQLTERSYVVVATMGGYDEKALAVALDSAASYVGLVASQRRFAAVLASLREMGCEDEKLARIERPEGLPSKTLLPAEIAFSVMAALLPLRRRHVVLDAEEVPAPGAEVVDPICGMAVDVATARHTSVRDGQTYYFCAPGCKARFEAA
jgi:xanthine dehydrogenase accessory factor